MKLSSPLFVALSSVVGPILIAAEPCANGYGKYDMTACNSCAENGNGQTGHSICCNAIYRHSLGRDDDDDYISKNGLDNCVPLQKMCFSLGKEGSCYPGLICVKGGGSTITKLVTVNYQQITRKRMRRHR